MSDPATSLLVARGVSKSFGAVRALVDVDFDVDAGEVVALVGDNGAGKSTLIKAIAGVLPADTGDYWIDGVPVQIPTPIEATRMGIATVYQDLALCDNLDVVGNLYLGSELVEPGLDNLDNVFHVADRVSVLRLGRHVATSDRWTTAREDVVAAITGARRVEAVAA